MLLEVAIKNYAMKEVPLTLNYFPLTKLDHKISVSVNSWEMQRSRVNSTYFKES